MGSINESSVPTQITEGIWPRSNERGYSIDERTALSPTRKKIIAIGAGMAGINVAMQVDACDSEFDLTVFDKASDVGGNWLWNQYPGLACDNPGVTYQYIKETNASWPSFYSSGRDIRDYLQDIVRKRDLKKYFSLGKEVVKAEWSDASCKWTVTVKDVRTGGIETEDADVVISCVGPLHHPKWPDLPKRTVFKGTFIHAARYPDDLDLKGKKLAVLGTGASGVQLVPAVLNDASQVYHWTRQPTFIFPLDSTKSGFNYTNEQIARFNGNPTYYLKYRKALEHKANQLTSVLIQGTPLSKEITKLCIEHMRSTLASRPDIAEKLIPQAFDFGCRRPTPGPGYLEALCDPKVTTFLEPMKEMTEKGFIDHEGREHEVDVFIAATGYDSSYVPSFPIVSRGINLQDKWTSSDPDAYLSIATPGFPNYFITSGPWGPTAQGSAIPIAELTISSFLSWIKKMATEQIACMEPTVEATQDFLEHAALWLRRSVFVQDCKSWWKASHSGLPLCFPGSRVMIIEMITNFRAEDWKFHYPSGKYMGNGFHPKEAPGSDDTYYLGLLDGKTTTPDYGNIVEENTPGGELGPKPQEQF